MTEERALLSVRGLSVTLPGGDQVVSGVDLELFPGKVVAILGPSGVGKTTFVRALLDPDELTARGFRVEWTARDMSVTHAFVPQRGALLDHLDVSGNIGLAQRAAGRSHDAAPWLAAVDLDAALGARGHSPSKLSGGQAQRVAVARTMAAGRRILVLDEPSVGLDPVAVRTLARLLVKQAREQSVAVLLITHDLALAGGAADEILFLDPTEKKLLSTLSDWAGPAEHDEEGRRDRLALLEDAVEARLRAQKVGARAGGPAASLASGSSLRAMGSALVHAFDARMFRESLVVFGRALRQSLLLPLPFYVVVGALLGFTVAYVIAHISTDLEPSAVLRIIGGTYVVALTPPLSAILFAATSGNALSAWLGGMRLHGQVLALEGLGIAPARYLWSPAWLALVFSYLVTAAAFFAAMILGGYCLFRYYAVPEPLRILTSDVMDPRPGQEQLTVRAAWLVGTYALAIASIFVARASAPKERSDDVTTAMTRSVMHATFFVVFAELISVVVMFARKGAR